mmetsp:Transcript_1407/g.1552  ORF Transcript_1407/g.1552 Transcript_1407/m.1552 type:complete len:177 (+) Transcript_1407:70-600(+)
MRMKFGGNVLQRRRSSLSSSSSLSRSNMVVTNILSWIVIAMVTILFVPTMIFQVPSRVRVRVGGEGRTITSSSVVSAEQVIVDDYEEDDDDEEEEEDSSSSTTINTHVRVLMWLEERALYAEENFFMYPWKNDQMNQQKEMEEDDDDDAKDNDTEDDSKIITIITGKGRKNKQIGN